MGLRDNSCLKLVVLFGLLEDCRLAGLLVVAGRQVKRLWARRCARGAPGSVSRCGCLGIEMNNRVAERRVHRVIVVLRPRIDRTAVMRSLG